ncbi:MAG: hypothetical protein AAGA84_11995 [Pseudomonadota bacterium]
MNRPSAQLEPSNRRERQGNVWSGAVAMVLLGMLAVALISSEMDTDDDRSRAPAVSAIIAGQ